MTPARQSQAKNRRMHPRRVNCVLTTKGSLVAATFTQIVMEKRNLRFVAIDGVEPSIESYEKGTYPFGKKLYLVVGSTKSPAVAHFLTFLRSQKGIAALREAGVLLGPE
jgi:ABC-type phosphate transport system substrate-binding protein